MARYCPELSQAAAVGRSAAERGIQATGWAATPAAGGHWYGALVSRAWAVAEGDSGAMARRDTRGASWRRATQLEWGRARRVGVSHAEGGTGRAAWGGR